MKNALPISKREYDLDGWTPTFIHMAESRRLEWHTIHFHVLVKPIYYTGNKNDHSSFIRMRPMTNFFALRVSMRLQ